MRRLLLIISLASLCGSVYSQSPKYVYTIKADSVKITNCDSAELIIQNHTQAIPGFLFNTGNGRTQFKRGLTSLGNGSFQIGADTLKPWVQGGNAWGAAGVFGTLDNNPLNFYTDNAQRMGLLTDGDLLINTTSDDGHDKLQVNGNIYTAGYLTNSTTALGGGVAGPIRLRYTGDGSYIDLYQDGTTKIKTLLGTAADNRPFDIFDSVGVSFLATPYISIGMETGENAKLTVANTLGGSLYDLSVVRQNPDSFAWDFVIMPPGLSHDATFVDNGSILQMNGRGTFAGNVGIGVYTPTAQLHTTGSVRFAGLTVDSALNNVVVCDTNGNLYTRSASSLAAADFPRSSLAVNGPIDAKTLTLHPTGWADFVFDSSYRLPALSAVESYIHREHHLSGMPSAAAVQANGIDVGETQTALLKKIEEITLYSIEQDKRIKEQQQQIESLKKEMAEIKKMITENATK